MAVRETNSISESSSCVRFFCFLSSCSFSWNSISVYHLDIFCFYYTIRIQLFIAGLSNYGIGAVAYQIIVLLYRTWAFAPGLSFPYPSIKLIPPQTQSPAPRAITKVCSTFTASPKNCILKFLLFLFWLICRLLRQFDFVIVEHLMLWYNRFPAFQIFLYIKGVFLVIVR